MKILRFSKQYKKDAKRFRNQPQKMEKVVKILGFLRDDMPVPEEYSPIC